MLNQTALVKEQFTKWHRKELAKLPLLLSPLGIPHQLNPVSLDPCAGVGSVALLGIR